MGALKASVMVMVQSIKDWKTALVVRVVAMMVFVLVDPLVIAPLQALPVEKLTPAVAERLQE